MGAAVAAGECPQKVFARRVIMRREGAKTGVIQAARFRRALSALRGTVGRTAKARVIRVAHPRPPQGQKQMFR